MAHQKSRKFVIENHHERFRVKQSSNIAHSACETILKRRNSFFCGLHNVLNSTNGLSQGLDCQVGGKHLASRCKSDRSRFPCIPCMLDGLMLPYTCSATNETSWRAHVGVTSTGARSSFTHRVLLSKINGANTAMFLCSRYIRYEVGR